MSEKISAWLASTSEPKYASNDETKDSPTEPDSIHEHGCKKKRSRNAKRRDSKLRAEGTKVGQNYPKLHANHTQNPHPGPKPPQGPTVASARKMEYQKARQSNREQGLDAQERRNVLRAIRRQPDEAFDSAIVELRSERAAKKHLEQARGQTTLQLAEQPRDEWAVERDWTNVGVVVRESAPEPQRPRGADDLAMVLYHLGPVDEENGYDGYFESDFDYPNREERKRMVEEMNRRKEPEPDWGGLGLEEKEKEKEKEPEGADELD